jgi:hypothetical protein
VRRALIWKTVQPLAADRPLEPAGSLADQTAPNLVCNGTYTGGTYGDVVVPSNDNCDISNATILGNVVAENGATLNLDYSTSAVVRGDVLTLSNTVFYPSDGWTIDGTTTANRAEWVVIDGGTTHDVVSNASSNFYLYDTTTVHGSVVANRTQEYGEIASGYPISGNVEINGSVGGSFAVIGQEIDGNLVLTDNHVETTVFENTIHQNLVCLGKNPPPNDGDGCGNYVMGREVGQCARFPNSPDDGA